MLQPRLVSPGCVCEKMEFKNISLRRPSWWTIVCAAILLSANLVTCQEINENEYIEGSRLKREGVQDNRDLTVLLVNDQKRDYNTKIGRYHSVKPLIGLLTSTARTFIQDGVTTEFATQILGTTLDNGRIYAQVLTKSSLVLYNKPSNVDDPFIVQPTRVHSAFDGQWNVKQDLGIIDPDKFILKNTDYLVPSSKMDIVYASKLAKEPLKFWNIPSAPEPQFDNQIVEEPTGRRIQAYNEIPRYEVYNYLDGPVIEREKKFEFIAEPSRVDNVNTNQRQSKAFEPVFESVSVNSNKQEDTINESNVVKVKPDYDLPTFTIKNEFSPIFYYIDNVESRHSSQHTNQQTKTPKKLFGQKSEPRPKKTFTYAGFADFTTVVGDTVIIFTPNTETSRPPNPEEVNVFPSAKPVDKLATKITFLSADIPVATATYNAHEVIEATKTTTSFNSEEKITEQPVYNDEESLKKLSYEVDDSKMPATVSVQYNNGFDFNLDVIQPSETTYTTTESTRPMEELEVMPIQEYNTQATEPLITIQPSTTVPEESHESVVTESNIKEIFTNSEEETENTAAEVTEKMDESEDMDEDDEEENTTESHDVMTTTESGHSEESFEDIETTTETKHDKHEEIYCTDGLETQSTMTTAYKTLTYLTTYFIPLENTETTTSVESNIVVTSDMGFLTNIVCKTNINIEPTSVISVELKSSEQTNLETPEVMSDINDVPPTQLDTVTENPSRTTPMEKERLTTVHEEESTTTNNEVKEVTEHVDNDLPQTTTTERVSTSHIEVSVSTETSPTEKPVSEEYDDAKVSENEIDLIYKTLYTTYTYFTTFFGDHTSSVASHKSVVTNIITSTVDLSNLDPSLLGAFGEDDIAPTNVGVGRSTETLAINSIIDLVKNKDVIESVENDGIYSSQTPTPSLGEDGIASIKPDAVKTYFTTYTFFTTIYVGADANVCSRSEIYTNYIGPDELIPTKSNPLLVENTRAQFDFRNCKQIKRNQESITDVPIESTNNKVHSSYDSDDSKKDTIQPTPIEVDMLLSIESNPLESDNLYVTDVKSSSSKGDRKIIDNNNIILDDQISSESNIEEILPSPTLLLQTSYTTFTYFTTMYIGKDSSNVKSRLETITNVVTETITPKAEPEEENNLPITYYTTFTYWTTLCKDKSTTITSREEIVSNVVTPVIQSIPTISPIDTTPIDIDSVISQKELEVGLKPSVVDENLEQDDGKATFYTTYTYFTTFYAGNISQIRSSLKTVTNVVENSQVIEDNQLGRKVGGVAADKNLIQDNINKINIQPSIIKEEIKTTAIPNISTVSSTVLLGTYIDNLYAEVKPPESSKAPEEKKILFSQVAVISGDSTIVTSDNKTLDENATTSSTSTTSSPTLSTEGLIASTTPELIESSVAETTTESKPEHEEEEDETNPRKKGRLTFTAKKPSFTPVIIPFASRNRPSFSPKRVPLLSSATTITRADSTPTITATPTLKSVRPSGFGGVSRKQSISPVSSGPGRRFSGRSSSLNLSANVPSASRSVGFGRASIQPSSRRTGFRSSSLRSNSLDYASRSAIPRIRPTASSRLRNSRQSSTVFFPPNEQNESETAITQIEENVTESLDEVTETLLRTTSNPLLKFRRPPIARQPGTAILPRSTTPTVKRSGGTLRGRTTTTTTKRTTRRSTSNPLLLLGRQRANSLFPRRNLFKQPEPEPEEEIKENEQKVEEEEELLEEEEFEEDNDYESSDRKEQQVATPSTLNSKRNNIVQIRPFAFRRRTKRQVDYGNRKLINFRRPGLKPASTRRPDPEPETEAPTPKPKTGRFNGRNTKTTTATAPKSSSRQSFIVRGESRTTSTTSAPAYRRGKARTSSRTTTTHSSRPKAPRLSNKSSGSRPSTSRSSTSRSRTRTTTSRASSRQRSSFENLSAERHRQDTYNHLLHDGKITITHQIPVEVTVPVVNGKITEYKNLLSARPSTETLPLNQVSTSIGPLGNQQLVLAIESTELAENGATKITKYVLHETPTTTVIFTPTTIRGRKTSYSHVLPSTVYSVEPVVQTISPEINANVPLANLLLSQLLLGNQQPALNPLLALQGQALLPQQPVVQTPVTEYKTRTTTFVTTVTDARETVLPITFRGKAILTTIVDPTTNVITATEFITDTVVTTPTVLAPPPQLNSLLLPLLLQQQQQQQQQQHQILSLPTANPLLGLAQPDLNILPNNNLNLNNDIYSNSPKPNILSDLNSNEDFAEDIDDSGEDTLPPPPPPPPSSHTRHRQRTPKPSPPKMTSVVTLYVSGKFPGEFSTVLSTVISDDTQTVRKREAIYYDDVQVVPSILPSIDHLVGSQSDFLENMVAYGKVDDSEHEILKETQSLESIVGKISDHIRYDASPTYIVKLANPSVTRQKEQNSLDDIS
ncbi:mucin-3A isoform X2 [Battus philenor]|uniref:mucin-3A isoform X2 n=1 Tax=Battus philenor TaxID=42288 RepID=UPI0035D09467